VARFLSTEWFDELDVTSGRLRGDLGPPDLVVDVVVSGAPEGEVRYQLVVDGERARIVSHEDVFRSAQVELSSDYATMAGIASGNLSALSALSAGRARLSGDIGALSSAQPAFGGVDLLPPPVRAGTTF
jgi:SCP-2 sterol transfer family